MIHLATQPLTRDEVGDRDLLAALRKPTTPRIVPDIIADGFDATEPDEMPHTDGIGCQVIEWLEENIDMTPGKYPADPQEHVDTQVNDGDVCHVLVSPSCNAETLEVDAANGGYWPCEIDGVDFDLEFTGPVKAQDKTGEPINVLIVKAVLA